MDIVELKKAIPGAVVPPERPTDQHYDPFTDFAWLDSIDNDNCFMQTRIDPSNNTPSKSLDFGRDGVTGSVSTWHELLQMTAPDDECGVVFARGDFPDTPDSILARAQRRNQRGAFGLEVKIDEETPYVLERTSAQGFINMRWPYSRFNFVRGDTERHTSRPKSTVFAHKSICSFVKDKTLYQVLRISPAKLFQSSDSSEVSSLSEKAQKPTWSVWIQVGGMVRVGCSNTCLATPVRPRRSRSIPAGRSGRRGREREKQSILPIGLLPQFYDTYIESSSRDHHILAFESTRHEQRLEIRVWVNQAPIALDDTSLSEERKESISEAPEDDEFRQAATALYAKHELKIPDYEPVNVVASFTFVPKHRGTSRRSVKAPDPTTVMNYLGYTDSPRPVTEPWSSPYRLWSMVLNTKTGADESASFRLSTIGRCIEVVTGVLLVPTRMATELGAEPEPKVDANEDGVERVTVTPTALVRNIVAHQSVDLASALWHIRLITRAYNVLQQSAGPPDLNKPVLRTRFRHMKEEYMDDLSVKLQGILLWTLRMVPALAEGNPEWQDGGIPVTGSSTTRSCRRKSTSNTQTDYGEASTSNTKTNPKSRKAHGQVFFCALIAWYLMKNASFVYDSETHNGKTVRAELWNHLEALANVDNNDNGANTVAMEQAEGCILRWYHSHSVVKMSVALRKEDPAGYEAMQIDLEKHEENSDWWRSKARKAVRLYGQGRFARRTIGHKIANLAALCGEIDAEDASATATGLSCLDYVKELVHARQETDTVESGAPDVQRWDESHAITSAMPRPAPWELSCLGHHLPVNLDIAKSPSDTLFLQECQEFLLSDYTFIPSWDHSLAGLAGLWWDLTTSSIICAKALERPSISTHDGAGTHPDEKGSGGVSKNGCDVGVGSGASGGESASSTPSPQKEATAEGQEKMIDLLGQIWPTKKQEELLELLDKISRGKKPDYIEGFNWRKRHPGPLYHADTSVQSLEDTPHVYRLKQTHNVRLRPNIRQVIMNNFLPEPDWSLRNIKECLPAEKLRHISCFDYTLCGSPAIPEVALSSVRGRALCRWDNSNDISKKVAMVLKRRLELWDLYFLGEGDLRKFAGLKEVTEDQRMLLDVRDENPGAVRERLEFLEAYGKSLFRVLNDSLVDLGTKYRIIFARSLPPPIVQVAVHIWHPDGIDTFDNHLGTLSHFFDSKGASTRDEMWLSSITLAHWRPQNDVESKLSEAQGAIEETEKKKREKEEEEKRKRTEAAEELPDDSLTDGDSSDDDEVRGPGPSTSTAFPPASVEDWRSRETDDLDPQNQLSSISEQSISLVITGDGMGRSWTCSLVCDLIDERMMVKYAAEIKTILQMFIHQQYTGRALVFTYLLGQICRTLSMECERFMNQIDKIMGVKPMVLLQGMQWDASDAVVQKLKEMLWGLQALRIFDLKLESAIVKIQEARKSLEDTINLGHELRPLDMKRLSDRIWEEFNQRYGRLENAHNAINQRLDQGARLREGISSVVSIEQNENISMLTWVTIAYLPLAFAVAIFSIQRDILPEGFGKPEFGGLLVAFLAVTVAFALALGWIIRSLRRVKAGAQKRWTRRPRPQAAWEYLGKWTTWSDVLAKTTKTGHGVENRGGLNRRFMGHGRERTRDEEAAQPNGVRR